MNNYESAKNVAAYLKVIGWIIFLGGIIGAIYMGYTVPTVDDIFSSHSSHGGEFNTVIFLAASFSSVISGFLIMGFGEVISLLIGLNQNAVVTREEIIKAINEKETTVAPAKKAYDDKLPPL